MVSLGERSVSLRVIVVVVILCGFESLNPFSLAVFNPDLFDFQDLVLTYWAAFASAGVTRTACCDETCLG